MRQAGHYTIVVANIKLYTHGERTCIVKWFQALSQSSLKNFIYKGFKAKLWNSLQAMRSTNHVVLLHSHLMEKSGGSSKMGSKNSKRQQA